MRIVIGIPSPDFVSPQFAFGNLPAIIARGNEQHEIHLMYQTGVRTDKNRNQILQKALEIDADAILWLDADEMYPHNIIQKLVDSQKDVIGSLYFKRSHPFAPVAYLKGKTDTTYTHVDPNKIPKDSVIEVDGLGFGGVLVKMYVYKSMGDDMWMNYGSNFHLPYKTDDQETHDLRFCRLAKNHGFHIYLHTGVKPGHLAEKVITEKDWDFRSVEKMEQPKITILIPTIHVRKAQKIAKLMRDRAGLNCEIIVGEDKNRIGWVAMINALARDNPSDFFVYAADDAYPSRNFLKEAFNTLKETGAGLVGFNEGKFQDLNAGFALVDYDWVKNIYGGDILFSGYHSHYSEPELTMIAKQQHKFAYNPRASLIEIVFNKDGKKVVSNNLNDRDLFHKRMEMHFDGLVDDPKILNTLA